MSLLERFSAHVTAKFVVVLAPTLIRGVKVTLVVRAHVVDEVGRHPETGVALGAPVLRQLQRRKRRRQSGTAADAVRRLGRRRGWTRRRNYLQ